MVHIRIIHGRSYKYTTHWNPKTKKVDNVYLGAVNPIRMGIKREKKLSAPILSARERLFEAKRRHEQILKATLKQLGYSK